MLPFHQEELPDSIVIRTFPEETPDEELKWHWDEEDRTIFLTHETDWMFQMDNQLPEKMKPQFFIPAGKWHRVIKGTGSLTVKILK